MLQLGHCASLLVAVVFGSEVTFGVPVPDTLLPNVVHTHPPHNCFACPQTRQPRDNVRVLRELQEGVAAALCVLVAALRQREEPRVHRHVGDGVLGAAHVLLAVKMPVQDVAHPLHLLRVPVDAVLDVAVCVREEVAERLADDRSGGHLPHQPVDALRPTCDVLRDEALVLVGKVHEYRPRLEEADGAVPPRLIVVERRDLRVRVQAHEAGCELLAGDLQLPRVVLHTQLLQHDRHLLPVRRAQRVQLQRVRTAGQLAVLACAGGVAVDRGEHGAGGHGLPHVGHLVALGQRRLLLHVGVSADTRRLRNNEVQIL
eukprot:Rhum_TRINITY_DN10709_c0_g1::Rhum_TRINITY_DN10709_c0_g1_i1::g.39757::m.39757